MPVDWVDDPDSRVDIVATAVADLKGMLRLGRALGSGRLPIAALREQNAAEAAVRAPEALVGQLIRFAVIGLLSTAAYLLLFLALRGSMPALAANAVALLVTAVANTAINRRVTFGVRGTAGRFRAQAQGLVVFALGLGLTSGTLLLLHRFAPNAAQAVEIAALLSANICATLLRFLLFRAWVFPQAANPAAARLTLAGPTEKA